MNWQPTLKSPLEKKPFELMFTLGILSQVCAMLVAAMGLIALLGWILGSPYLSSLGTGNIPVAPSTALLFVLFAAAIFLRARFPSSRAAYRMGLYTSLAGGSAALALFFLSYRGIYLEIEHIGISIVHAAGQITIGHMSPLTAVCFVIASLSYLILLYSTQRSRRADLSWWLAGILAVFGFSLLLAYLFGVPIFYGSSFIPPAALTSIAFITLGIALMGLAAPHVWLFRDVKTADSSIRIGFVYLLIFILLIAIITASGYISYRNFEKQFLIQEQRQLSAIAELKVNGLVNWRKERLTDAELLHQNSVFATLVQAYFEDPQDAVAQAQLQDWLKSYQIYPDYDRLRLLDAQGQTRLSSTADIPPISSVVVKRIAEVMQSKQATLVDFYRRDTDGQIRLCLLIPILYSQADDQVIGLVAISIDPHPYLYPFIQEWPSDSTSAEALLVRREGNDVLFLNELRFQTDTALSLRIPLEQTEVLAVKAVLGQSGVVEGTDYRDAVVIGDLNAVPDSPWFLVTRMDTAEVYAPLRMRLWQTFGLIGMAIFVAGAGLTTVWRQQRIQYYRAQIVMTQTLLDSEKKFKIAFDTSPDAIIIARLSDDVFISVNKGFEQLSGYTQEEVIGKTSSEINIWKDPEDHKNVIEELQANGKIHNYEASFVMLDGEIHGLSSAVIIDLNGVPHVLHIIRDITARKQAEEALRESEDKFKYVFEYSMVGKSITQFDGGIQVNQALCDILGYSSQEMQDKKWQEITHPDDIDLTQDQIKLLTAGEKNSVRFIKRFIHKNGSIVWVDLSSTIRRDGQHTPMYLMSSMMDITERKQAEVQLQGTLEELKRSNTELEQFAYIASHDLQEPLRAVAGMVQLLQKRYQGQLDERADEYIHHAMEGATRMQTLINDLLAYSRVERRGNPFQAVDANKILTSALRNLQAAISERGATVTNESLPTLEADATQLTQLFQNLIGNAIKFHSQRPPQIHIAVETLDEAWHFSVRDNGIGIEPQYFERIFLVFQRLHTRREYPGTGIGLSICKKIVERHGGRIWIESQPGQGSAFHFTIPFRR